MVPGNYSSGQLDTCGCCAIREIYQHLRHCQLKIFNAFPSTENTTSVSQIFSFSGLPPWTIIFLSCSLLGQIYSLIKHTAVSQLMAKLRNPEGLISPSSQVHALTSSWLSGETENDHPKAQGVWFPGRSKLTNILKKLAPYGSVHLSCNGVPAGGTQWLRTHWTSRKVSGCQGDDMAHWPLPVHSHLSHVLLSGVYVLFQLSPAVKLVSCKCVTSWDS